MAAILAMCTAAVLCGCAGLDDIIAWIGGADPRVLAALGCRRNALGVLTPPHPETVLRVLADLGAQGLADHAAARAQPPRPTGWARDHRRRRAHRARPRPVAVRGTGCALRDDRQDQHPHPVRRARRPGLDFGPDRSPGHRDRARARRATHHPGHRRTRAHRLAVPPHQPGVPHRALRDPHGPRTPRQQPPPHHQNDHHRGGGVVYHQPVRPRGRTRTRPALDQLQRQPSTHPAGFAGLCRGPVPGSTIGARDSPEGRGRTGGPGPT
ncbi:MAG: hypothetical protein ACRDRW_01400 [Pseudonocardiaceae bacterium]